MEVGHILLGRPWQSDRKVIHDGYTNRHSFEFNGRRTILLPMTPKKVYADQLHLKRKEGQVSKRSNFFVKSNVVKKALFANKPMLLFVYKEALMSLTDLAPVLPSEMLSLAGL